jgi:hypothetical protein
MRDWPTGVDPAAPWFHGSSETLTELRPGSTITQDRDLVWVFSHKPSPTSDGRGDPGGVLRHNGRRTGWLYALAEPVRPDDLVPVLGSVMPGKEWHTPRPLRVTRLEATTPVPAELLSPEREAALRRRGPSATAPASTADATGADADERL